MLSQAMAIAEQLGDQRLLGTALVSKAFNHCFYMEMPQAVDSGLRAAELLRSVGDLWELARVLWGTQVALLLLCRFDEVTEIDGEMEPLASRLGHLGALLIARRSRGLRELMLIADLDRFEEFARGDLEFCRSAGMPWISHSYSYLGLAHFYRGHWQKALEHFQEAVKLESPSPFAGSDWVLLFLWKAYSGHKDEALAMLRERMGDLPRSGQANTLGTWTILFGVVEGSAFLGERDEAAKLYPLVLEAIDTGAGARLWTWGLLQTVAGMAAAAGGQWDKAEEHYQTALRQAHELPIVMEQPEVRRWYARMLIDRDASGDRDKARQLLTEAIEDYRRIGMPKHVEMAEALLGEV
jgi:tetratricopeptide (TPR) repeat protein